MEDTESFPAEIEEWYSMTQRLRNVIAAEYLMVPKYATMPDSERVAEMAKKYDELISDTREDMQYLKFLAELYPQNKPYETELIAGIKRIMKAGR